jgi:hypothetical protein
MRIHIRDLFADLPRYVPAVFGAGGFLVSAFSSRFPESWQDIGLYAGIAAAASGALAAVWHGINKWREWQGCPKLQSHPLVVLVFLLLIAGSVTEYLWFSNALSRKDATIATKDATIATLQDEARATADLGQRRRTEYFEMAEQLAKAQNQLADTRRKQELSQGGSFFVLDSQHVKMNSNIHECNKAGQRSFGTVGSSNVEMNYNYDHC